MNLKHQAKLFLKLGITRYKMAKGAYYPIYQKLWLYSNAAQAQAYGSNYSSTISPNTGSDSGSYNAISSVEGKGNCYVDTSVGMTAYYPAFPVWWVPSWGGSGYAIGWTNDSKNASASVPTLSTSSTDIGNSVTINFNRQSSSFTHTVDYWLVGTGYTNLINKTSATSYTWNTNSYKSTLLRALPTSTSGSFQIRVSTYNGATLVGTEYKDLTLKVPLSIKPTIGSIKAEETNSKLKDTLKVDSFVKGLSKIKVSATGVTAGQGSSISSYTWQIYDTTKTGASPTFSPFNFGSGVFKLTVSDKRGRSTTYTGSNITQVSYSQPSITAFSASRYNEANKTQVQIILKANQTKLSDKNTMRYKLEYKKSTETAWKQLKAYSSYQLGNFNVTTVQTIANDAKYNIRVSVQDLIGNVTTSIFTVTSTSKKWLEVTNGETINVIGTLQNNGSNVITEANNSLVKLNLNFTNGATAITVQNLGVENPLMYGWIIQPIYKSGTEILHHGFVQPEYNRLVLYLRTTGGVIPEDGSYEVFLMRVDLA